MLRYLETFYRHRVLLVAPMGVVILLSVLYVLVQPLQYISTAHLFVDQPTPGDQALGGPIGYDNPYLTPAENEAANLSELLSTQSFDAQVGRLSTLAGALRGQALHPRSGLAALHGSARALTDAELDAQLLPAVQQHALVFATGPQVMTVTFSWTDPRIAASVAQTIVSEFINELLLSQREQDKTVVAFYQAQLKSAGTALTNADAALSDYLAVHPDQRSDSAVPTTAQLQLKRDDDHARSRYDDLVQKLNQGQLDLAALSNPGAGGLRIIDNADVPGHSTLSKKLLFQAAAGGLAVALVILVGGLLLLTAADRTLRAPGEVEPALGLRVVASVPELR